MPVKQQGDGVARLLPGAEGQSVGLVNHAVGFGTRHGQDLPVGSPLVHLHPREVIPQGMPLFQLTVRQQEAAQERRYNPAKIDQQ